MIEIRHEHIHTPDDESQAYDHIYDTQSFRHLDSLYLWILSLLKAKPGQSLLDVSSGEGSLIYFATRQGLRAYGVDFSEVALRKGIADYAARSVCVANSECLPIAGRTFDFITNIGSIEHYFQPELAMCEMSRLLKPGGVACILLPNGFSFFGNVKHVWQHGDVFDDGQPLQRYNTRLGWQRLLEANGLQVFEAVKYERERPLTRRDLIWYLRRPAKLLKLAMVPFVPLNLANSLVYLCRPISGHEHVPVECRV